MNGRGRGLWILLAILLLFVLLGPLIGGGMMGWGGMGPGMMGGYGPRAFPPGAGGWAWGLAMGLGGLVMLAFWGALAVGIMLLVRAVTRSTRPTDRSCDAAEASALDILKRRYAAGEITPEQYAEMRQTLER